MAKKPRITLTLKGFDDLLEKIQLAGGNINSATEKALLKSAALLDNEIRVGAIERGIETDTMVTPVVKWEDDVASIEVGFKMGEYKANNPNSSYKALFKEYGTGSLNTSKPKQERQTTKGYKRGSSAADPFIRPAKEKNASKIKRIQKDALNEILKELE